MYLIFYISENHRLYIINVCVYIYIIGKHHGFHFHVASASQEGRKVALGPAQLRHLAHATLDVSRRKRPVAPTNDG